MTQAKFRSLQKLLKEYAVELTRGSEPPQPPDPMNQEPEMAEVVALVAFQVERRIE